jgi:hypothetical protein
MLDRDNGKNTTWLKFFVMFATEGWLSVYGKTRILLGNPDIPIERSHQKTFKKIRRLMLWFKRYSSMNMVIFAVMLCLQRWICSYINIVHTQNPIYIVWGFFFLSSINSISYKTWMLWNEFFLYRNINTVVEKEKKSV